MTWSTGAIFFMSCRTEQFLYGEQIDIEGKLLFQFTPSSGETRSWPLPHRPGALALTPDPSVVLLAFEKGLSTFHLETSAITQVAPFEADKPTTRMNDGRCDHQGRFVVGGYNEAWRTDGGQALSGLYRLDAHGKLERLLEKGFKCSNGVCFSPDGSILYVTDSPSKQIYKWDYPADGSAPTNERLFYKMPPDAAGVTDGSVADVEGGIWNAQYGGSRVVHHHAEDGEIDIVIDMSDICPNPTCITLGGEDLRTLYITTARRKLTTEQLQAMPTSGGLFSVRVPTPGLPDPLYTGALPK
eukprot:jgi/Mesvir1/15443/Mv06626-RA.1